MKSWQKELLKVVSRVEDQVDKQKFELKNKLNLLKPLTIQAYNGFGSHQQLYMRGRVLESEGLEQPSEHATVWQNLKRMFHRYESDEVPEAPLEFQIAGLKDRIRCDVEGFFEIKLPEEALPDLGNEKWQKIKLRLLKQYHQEQEEVKVEGEIMVRQPENTFGLISDIDDTIMVSEATDFLEKIRVMVLRNATTRKPFEGVGAFYRALEAGKNKKAQNPIFYISSSSWNLYDLFERFCQINGIPKGVFLLRELGISENKFIRGGHESHKLEKISHVLEAFPDLPFVLIGDSGQKDPEIYQEVVKRYPGRIKTIYIRDVEPVISGIRDSRVKEIAEEVARKGVEMKLVKDSLEAAKHAVELGLIARNSLAEIEKDTYEDKKLPSDISQTLGLDKVL